MADEETRIRITAVDNTAAASRSAASNIDRIGQATRNAMSNAQRSAQIMNNAITEGAKRTGRSFEEQKRIVEGAGGSYRRLGDEAEKSGRRQESSHQRAGTAAKRHRDELDGMIGRYASMAVVAEGARRAFVNFGKEDERLRRMGNQAGETNERMQQLKVAIESAAKASGVGFADMVEGLDELRERAQLSVNDIEELAPAFADASRAAGVSGKEYARVFGSLMTNMGVTKKNAKEVMDIIQKGINDNQIEIQEFSAQIPKLTEAFEHWGLTGVQGATTMMAVLGRLKQQTGDTGKAAQSLSQIMEKSLDPKVTEMLGYSVEGLKKKLARLVEGGENPLVAFLDMLEDAAKKGVDLDQLMGFRIRGTFRKLTGDTKALKDEIRKAGEAQGQVAKDTANLNAGANKSVLDIINAYDRMEKKLGEVLAQQGTPKALDDITNSLETINQALTILKNETGEGIDWDKFLNVTGLDARWEFFKLHWKRLWALLKGENTKELERQMLEIQQKTNPAGVKELQQRFNPSGPFGNGADHRGGTVTPTNPNPGFEGAAGTSEYEKSREGELTKGVNKELDRSVVLLRDFNRWMDDLVGAKAKGGVQTAALTTGVNTTTDAPASPTTKAPAVIQNPPSTATTPPAPPAPPATPPAGPAPAQTTDTPTVNPPRPYVTPPRGGTGGKVDTGGQGSATPNPGSTVSPDPAITNDLSRAAYDARFKGSKLEGHYDTVVNHAIANGVPPSLMASIMAFETGGGQNRAIKEHNNPAGLMNGKQHRNYDTIEEGIAAAARTQGRHYRESGGDLVKFAHRPGGYSPIGAGNDKNGTNKEWPSSVGKIQTAMRAESGQPYQVAGPATAAPPQTANPASQAPVIRPSEFDKAIPKGQPGFVPYAQGPASSTDPPIASPSGVGDNSNRVNNQQLAAARMRAAQGDPTASAKIASVSVGVSKSIDEALKLAGKNENRDKAELQQYMKTGKDISSGANPWCASFVNTIIERAGGKGTTGDFDVKGGKSWWAKDFAKWGTGVKADQPPSALDVVVWDRNGQGHVSAMTGESRKNPKTGVTEYAIVEGNVGGSKKAGHTGEVAKNWVVRNSDGSVSRVGDVAGGGRNKSIALRRGEFPPDQDPTNKVAASAPNASADPAATDIKKDTVDPKPATAAAAPTPAPVVQQQNPASQAPAAEDPAAKAMRESGLQRGGPASAGSTHLVGEAGPELVKFGQQAHVFSNDMIRPLMSRTDYDNPGATARFARSTMRREANREVREARWDSYSDIGAA
jgi:TP901 family phage tail tape measure protein